MKEEGKKRIVSSATCLRIKIPYNGKLSREKLSQILWLFAKVFFHKIWGCGIFCVAKASNLQKFSQ